MKCYQLFDSISEVSSQLYSKEKQKVRNKTNILSKVRQQKQKKPDNLVHHSKLSITENREIKIMKTTIDSLVVVPKHI